MTTTEIYRMVDIRIHTDDRYRALSSGGRELFNYFLTCGNDRSIPGFLHVSLGEAAAKLTAHDKRWSDVDVKRTFDEIAAMPFDEAAGQKPMAVAEWDAHFVWLPARIRHPAPSRASTISKWGFHWRSLPECQLRLQAWHATAQFLTDLDEEARADYSERLAQFEAQLRGESPAKKPRGPKPKKPPSKPEPPESLHAAFKASCPAPKVTAATIAWAERERQLTLVPARNPSEITPKLDRNSPELGRANSGEFQKSFGNNPELGPNLVENDKEKEKEKNKEKEKDLSEREHPEARPPATRPTAVPTQPRPGASPSVEPISPTVFEVEEIRRVWNADLDPVADFEDLGPMPETPELEYAGTTNLALALRRHPDAAWWVSLGQRVKEARYLYAKRREGLLLTWWVDSAREGATTRGENRIQRLRMGEYDRVHDDDPRPPGPTRGDQLFENALRDQVLDLELERRRREDPQSVDAEGRWTISGKTMPCARRGTA